MPKRLVNETIKIVLHCHDLYVGMIGRNHSTVRRTADICVIFNNEIFQYVMVVTLFE